MGLGKICGVGKITKQEGLIAVWADCGTKHETKCFKGIGTVGVEQEDVWGEVKFAVWEK